MKFDNTKAPALDYIEFEVATVTSIKPDREEVKRVLELMGLANAELMASINDMTEDQFNRTAIKFGLRLEAGEIALKHLNKYEPIFEKAMHDLRQKKIIPPETDYTTLYNQIPNSEDVSFGGLISFPKNTSSPAKNKLQDMVNYHLKDIRENIRDELGIFRYKTGLEVTWNYPKTKALGRS